MSQILIISIISIVSIISAVLIYFYLEKNVPIQTSEQPTYSYPQTTQTTSKRIVNKPVDCQMSEWSFWSKCSIDGKQKRERTIITKPSNGGTPCDTLIEEKDCPVNCELGDWLEWSECNPTLGKQTRERKVIISAKNGGSCGDLIEEKKCTITLTTPVSTLTCPKIEDNKDSNYTFSNTPKLGSEILKSLKEKFIFLFKEKFNLSTNIITDINTLDINKYYYIGIRNASGENPGCIVQFPLQVYKVA